MPDPVALRLEWTLDGQEGSLLLLPDRRLVLGRSLHCDAVLSSPTVSRQHAAVFAVDGQFYVENLSRTNAVRVGGEIRLAAGERAPLQVGEVVGVGPVEIRVVEVQAELPVTLLKIRCRQCERVLDATLESFCPWDGAALAGCEVVIVEEQLVEEQS